jgi:preprotein translocase SecE subunit
MNKQTQDSRNIKSAIIGTFEKLGSFLYEVKVELVKCTWPSRKELFGSSMVVIVSVLILAAVVSFFDILVLGFLKLVIHSG